MRVAGDDGGDEVRDVAGAAGHMVGEHGDGDAVIDEDFVVGDKAGDFAAVFDGAVAIAIR